MSRYLVKADSLPYLLACPLRCGNGLYLINGITRLPLMELKVLLDGLYSDGSVLEICCSHNWDSMIVFQDKGLGNAWEDYEGLRRKEIYRSELSG